MKSFLALWSVAAALGFAAPSLLDAQAADADSVETARVFTLGEIVVLGTREGGIASAGASEIGEERMRVFARATLDDAVNLAPGVIGGFSGSSRRNEANVFVRGQDRWRVPLYLDGVRIYLPADNRIDFARFLTANLSAVQIQKGYASVLDGPEAMGGAINIVTRRPTEPFESEIGISLGGRNQMEEWSGHLSAGARREGFYALAGFTLSDRDSWSLSDRYHPSAYSNQGRGVRLGSDAQDSNLNLKVGLTPNATDEYALNFLRQEGEKSGLLDIYNNPPPVANSFWKWPLWGIRTLSFLSRTRIGSASEVKAKVYYNTFGNALYTYDDVSYTTQSLGRAARSYFDDQASGASLQVGTNLGAHTLQAAFHYRHDVHLESQHNRPTHPTLSLVEPEQRQSQTTWSLAAENTVHAYSNVDVLAGLSYEAYRVTRSDEYTPAVGLFEREEGGASAINWQAAAIWRRTPARQLHASVSSRTRFPGLWELYSTRFGTATPNPDLGPERATNVELGWSEAFGNGARVTAAVFYSDLADLIQSVPLDDRRVQPRNVGDGRFYGFELSAELAVSPTLTLGGHYGFIHRTIVDEVLVEQREERELPQLELTEVPPHAAFAYATWRPVERVSVTPSVQFQSDRWTDVTAVNTEPASVWPDPQIKTGAHALVDVLTEVRLTEQVTVSAGGKNLLDQYYELVWGVPEAGRRFFVTMRTEL